MNDVGAGLVVLFLGDPHGLEGREGGQDGATDPGGVLTSIFIVLGARAVSSFCNRSAKPGNMVEPPDRTMLVKSSLLSSK